MQELRSDGRANSSFLFFPPHANNQPPRSVHIDGVDHDITASAAEEYGATKEEQSLQDENASAGATDMEVAEPTPSAQDYESEPVDTSERRMAEVAPSPQAPSLNLPAMDALASAQPDEEPKASMAVRHLRAATMAVSSPTRTPIQTLPPGSPLSPAMGAEQAEKERQQALQRLQRFARMRRHQQPQRPPPTVTVVKTGAKDKNHTALV